MARRQKSFAMIIDDAGGSATPPPTTPYIIGAAPTSFNPNMIAEYAALKEEESEVRAQLSGAILDKDFADKNRTTKTNIYNEEQTELTRLKTEYTRRFPSTTT